MLPKPEKTKKQFPSDEIDNIEESKEEKLEKERKRLQTKRRSIIICLILTAGLSLSFWLFRSIKNLISSPPQINFHLNLKLPQSNKSPKITQKSSDQEIDKLVKNIDRDLSIIVLSPEKTIYQYQPDFVNQSTNSATIFEQLSQTKASPKSLIENLNLPQGLLFQENISQSPKFIYQNLISLPKDKILLMIYSPISQTSTDYSKKISTLIEDLYWYSINQVK